MYDSTKTTAELEVSEAKPLPYGATGVRIAAYWRANRPAWSGGLETAGTFDETVLMTELAYRMNRCAMAERLVTSGMTLAEAMIEAERLLMPESLGEPEET